MIGVLLALIGGCGGKDDTPQVPASYDIDTLGIPKFVAVNYIDPDKKNGGGNFIINRISRFRSSEGHDYSSFLNPGETCRSMKHYFKYPDASTEIFSPVAGTITRIQDEWVGGTQIDIRSDAQPAFTFTLFHINENHFTLNQKVAEGELLGTHCDIATYSDIAVYVVTPTGYRLVSYFETLTLAALKPFTDRWPTFLAVVIIPKALRDANPLNCPGEGDYFVNPHLDPLDKDIDF